MAKLSSLITLFVITLTSCTSYQYVKLGSSLQVNDQNSRYYFEDNSVYIDFDFWAQDFQQVIHIKNTGDEPIYIDLEKSIFVKNNMVVRDLLFPTFAPGSSYYNQSSDSPVLFIPSGRVMELHYRAYPVIYSKSDKRKGESKYLREANRTAITAYHTELDQKIQSLLEIEFYLADNPDFNNSYTLTFPFYATDVYTTSSAPNRFPLSNAQSYYTVKASQAGVGLVVGLMLAGAVAGAFE